MYGDGDHDDDDDHDDDHDHNHDNDGNILTDLLWFTSSSAILFVK